MRKETVNVLGYIICITAVLLVCISRGYAAAGISRAEAVVFFDRGHYWIEVTMTVDGGRAADLTLERSRFRIDCLDSGKGPFVPSRVEVVRMDAGTVVVVLSSGRLRGRRCYTVRYIPDDGEEVLIGPVCDPFSVVPGEEPCGPKRFFTRYIASAFSRSGDVYRLNQFRYEYDLSAERSHSCLVIEPEFSFGGWSIAPSFEHERVTYRLEESGKTPASLRRSGLSLSRAEWVGDLRMKLAARYGHVRSEFSGEDGGNRIFSHDLTVEGSIRIDNLFDSINRYCLSVFKGVELGFGYAWYHSNDEEVWGSDDFERTTPLARARFTWTFLYGFQLSYCLESFWPDELGDRFEEFHSFRLRLLLRDVVERPSNRWYHPDLELVVERGRRLPLFEEEERISLGFTFDLYPW